VEGSDAIQRNLDRLEMGLCKPHEVQQGQVHSPAHGLGNSKHKCKLSRGWVESRPAEQDLGCWWIRK